MKKLMMLAAILAMVLAAAVPAAAQVVNEFDDQELESGDFEAEPSMEINGNNNPQCGALLPAGQTGNVAGEEGVAMEDSSSGSTGGASLDFGPSNSASCSGGVEQKSEISS